MKSIWTLLLLAAFAGEMWAANPSCPVSLQDVRRDTGLGDRNTYCFSLDVKNNTQRPIAVVNLKAVALDSKPWEHPLRYTYVVQKLTSTETRNAYFSTHRLLGTDYKGVKVWVDTIEFQDKGVWSDSGRRSCGGADVKKK
jgi:hypothetical protein